MRRRWKPKLCRLESRITPFTPNDPLFGQQYHLALTQAPAAWDTTTGANTVIVAVADDGIALGHPDLAPSMWVNAKEIAGNKVDDDGNGFADDINGWDFFADDSNPVAQGGDTHGTHVAGIVGARMNNGVGVASYAGGGPNGVGIRLMPLRFVGNGVGTGTAADAAAALIYAADNGAKIINFSHTFDSFASSQTVIDAANYAYGKGVLIINSAGNNNQNNPSRRAFTQIVFTAAIDANDKRANFSNYGRFIDVAAPGVNVLSTTWDNNHTVFAYRMISGTSMAAPNAAGVAALIWSAHPTWTRDQVAAQLIGTATPIDGLNPGHEGLLGYGRVNASKAVTGTPPPPHIEIISGLPNEGGFTTDRNFTIEVDAPLRFDPATVSVADFELRGDGADDTFGTGDDTLKPLTFNNGATYQIGTDGLTITFTSNLAYDRYRFTVKSAGLTDPFGQQLDGDGNGAAGGDFTRTFNVAVESISGRFYEDLDVSLLMGNNDPRLPGWTAYLDANTNGKYDAGETTAVSDDTGLYAFLNLPAGSYTVRRITETGWLDNRPASGFYAITLASSTSGDSDNHFGQLQTSSVYCRVYEDLDCDGVRDAADLPLVGRTVILDVDGNGGYTAGEPFALSDGNGLVRVTGAPAGNFNLRCSLPLGWSAATPAAINVTTGPSVAATANYGQWQQNAVYGRIYDDADGDATPDVSETLLSDWRTFIDRNNNGQYDLPTTTIASPNVPLNTINMGTITSKLTIAGVNDPLTDVNVKLSITTAYTGDLTVTLIAPDGRRVRLFANIGIDGDNFTDTVLDDEGATALDDGNPPFTGSFRPAESLSLLDGMIANGLWQLEIQDLLASYTGKLTAWSLALETGEPVAFSTSHGAFVIPSLTAGTHSLRRQLQVGWGGTQPGADSYPLTMTPGATLTGRDFGQRNVPARVAEIRINDGDTQRSRVSEMTVRFDRAVSFAGDPAAAFLLTRTGPGTPSGNVTLAVDLSASTASRTVARITFAGPLTETSSIVDGNYQLTILATQVSENGVTLDGDGNGVAGGNAVMTLHRLFADADGDGDVDTTDFGSFRTAFGGSNFVFDFDGDGDVDTADFGQFRGRFGASI